MINLFGTNEIDRLRETDYKTESHTFSKGVIASYFNALQYPYEVGDGFIAVKRKKERVWFFPTNNKELLPVGETKDIIYSPIKTTLTKIKTKEVIYDLEKIFEKTTKEVRRGITLTNRKEIVLRVATQSEIEELWKEWSEHKMNDPKVYRISFTPKRYLRAFQLKDNGFNIVHLTYFINNQLYGAICYEIQDNVAFELAFISKYWEKDLKLTNDLNELILINSFHKLYSNHNILKINVGPTAGIKGLRIFKNKLPHNEHIIFSN